MTLGWIEQRYRVERELARGGMGVIYTAHDVHLDVPVAIKRLLLSDASPEQSLRFQREAQAAALNHPNVVRVHRVGVEGGQVHIVMDLVSGGTLMDLLVRDGPLEERRAARLVLALARAVAYAHEKGVLHRDLKPHNVLLGPDERPLLTDFGLAKLVSLRQATLPQADGSVTLPLDAPLRVGQSITIPGQILGTPSYMSPEQADGKGDERVDVYGLGATLYALLTGAPPNRGQTLAGLLTSLFNAPVPPPSSLRPGLDPALEQICLEALAKDPDARTPSAAALAEQLEGWLEGGPAPRRGASARRRRPSRKRPPSQRRRVRAPSSRRSMERAPGASPWVWVAPLGVLIALGWALSRGGSSPPPSPLASAPRSPLTSPSPRASSSPTLAPSLSPTPSPSPEPTRFEPTSPQPEPTTPEPPEPEPEPEPTPSETPEASPAAAESVASLRDAAESHSEAGEFALALERFRRALELAPDDPHLHARCGRMLFNLATQARKRREPYHATLREAANTLERATALDPGQHLAWKDLGHVLIWLDQTERALDALDHALRLDPDDPVTLLARGVARAEAQRFDEARADLLRVIERFPEHESAQGARGTLEDMRAYAKRERERAEELGERGQLPEALTHLERAIALEPEEATAHAMRGLALFRLDRYEDGATALRRAVELEPTFVKAWTNLGVVLLALQRPREAIEAFDEALALRPEEELALTQRGFAYLALGRRRRAERDFRRVLEISRLPAIRARAQEGLDQLGR